MDFVPHTKSEQQTMLKAIGLESTSDLFRMIPEELKNPSVQLDPALSEFDLTQHMQDAANKNSGSNKISFQGGGAYDHFIPQAVNALISRGDFATAYTPYQAEASQGTLQSIYEFQTLITRMTGMDVANASMYDGATALAEAALMACRSTRKEKVAISATINPHYKRVMKTYLEPPGVELVEIPHEDGVSSLATLQSVLDDTFAAFFMQQPNYFGIIEPAEKISQIVKNSKSLLGVSVYLQSLTLLKPPGAYNVDIVVGDLQPVGLPVSYGGPYAGFVACKDAHVRQLPGRLVGRTKDIAGNTGYVLTLQTREQHIRRQKATSNICTNQALCALASTIYITLMGPKGLRNASELSVRKAHFLQEQLCQIPGVKLVFDQPFFNEFLIELPVSIDDFYTFSNEQNIIPGIKVGHDMGFSQPTLLVCATEKASQQNIDHFVQIAKEAIEKHNQNQPATV